MKPTIVTLCICLALVCAIFALASCQTNGNTPTPFQKPVTHVFEYTDANGNQVTETVTTTETDTSLIQTGLDIYKQIKEINAKPAPTPEEQALKQKELEAKIAAWNTFIARLGQSATVQKTVVPIPKTPPQALPKPAS